MIAAAARKSRLDEELESNMPSSYRKFLRAEFSDMMMGL